MLTCQPALAAESYHGSPSGLDIALSVGATGVVGAAGFGIALAGPRDSVFPLLAVEFGLAVPTATVSLVALSDARISATLTGSLVGAGVAFAPAMVIPFLVTPASAAWVSSALVIGLCVGGGGVLGAFVDMNSGKNGGLTIAPLLDPPTDTYGGRVAARW